MAAGTNDSGSSGSGDGKQTGAGREAVSSTSLPAISLEEELEEVGFYIDQGLLDEAWSTMREVAVREGPKVTVHPMYKALKERLRKEKQDASDEPKKDEAKPAEDKAEDEPVEGKSEAKPSEDKPSEDNKAGDKEMPKPVPEGPVPGGKASLTPPVMLTPPPRANPTGVIDPSSPLGKRMAALRGKVGNGAPAASPAMTPKPASGPKPIAGTPPAPSGAGAAPGRPKWEPATAADVSRDPSASTPAGGEAEPLPPAPGQDFDDVPTGVELPAPLDTESLVRDDAGASPAPPAPPVSPVPPVPPVPDDGIPVEIDGEEEPTRERTPTIPPVAGAAPAAGADDVRGQVVLASQVSGAVQSAPLSHSADFGGETPFVDITEPVMRGSVPRKRWMLYGGIGGGAAILLIVILVAFSGSSGKKKSDTAGDGEDMGPRAAGVTDAAVSPRARPQPDAAPAKAPAPDAAVVPDAAVDAAAPKVRLFVTVEPPRARAVVQFRGKTHRGRSFESAELDPSAKPEKVEIRAPGYKTVTLTLTLSETLRKTVTLEVRPAALRPGRPSSHRRRRRRRRRRPRPRPMSMLIGLD